MQPVPLGLPFSAADIRRLAREVWLRARIAGRITVCIPVAQLVWLLTSTDAADDLESVRFFFSAALLFASPFWLLAVLTAFVLPRRILKRPGAWGSAAAGIVCLVMLIPADGDVAGVLNLVAPMAFTATALFFAWMRLRPIKTGPASPSLDLSNNCDSGSR